MKPITLALLFLLLAFATTIAIAQTDTRDTVQDFRERYWDLHLGPKTTAKQMLNIPKREYRTVPRDQWYGNELLDNDLVSVKEITAPNTGLHKLMYNDTIASLDDFILFCQTHHPIQDDMWWKDYSDVHPTQLPPYPPTNWNKVRDATVVKKVAGYTTYSLNFHHIQCRYYHLVVFSNGIVFVNASCGK